MLSLALSTLRTRWATFAGSFVALALGVALLAVMGAALAASADAPERRPERFAAAPVVVRGADTVRAPGEKAGRTHALAHPRPVPAEVVARLKGLGTVVEDRSFPVRTAAGGTGGPGGPGGPGTPEGLVGHPWSTAAFAPYALTAGRAPGAADEVVVSGDWAGPGDRVRTDGGTVLVTGTVGGRGFENAVFFTDERAAELSPLSLQLVVDAPAETVRDAVRGSEGVQVLTGDARHRADGGAGGGADRDGEAVAALNALFGTAGGVSAFVSVFVVASTYAFEVAQRRREFGLLRTAGATPGQVRRMVLAEALAVGVLASAAGCVLGAYGAPRLAAWVVDGGLAPRWFTIGDATWPYHLAFWTGLSVAVSGVAAASWRAGRTGPAQALREASVDREALTPGRRWCGVALLAASAALLAVSLVTDPGDLLHRKTYVSRPMLLITAVALLAPVLVRPLTRLIAWLPAKLPGAGGMLVRESAAAGVRRTAAVAAPVLVTVALAGSLLGATATLNAAKAAETRAGTAAAFVVTARAGAAGFDAEALRRLRAVDGAVVSASASSAVHVLEDGVSLVRSEARAADPGPLAATVRLPLVAGSAGDLDDDSIIVNEEWQRHEVDRRVEVWLGDGTRKSLRIAAVMAVGTGNNGVYVTPRNAPGATVDRVDVALAAGAEADAVAAGLHAAVAPSGGRVLTKEQWVRASYPETNRTTRLGLLLVLGIALLYTGISLANTMVMATADRVRDLAVLRLAGGTRWQVLRVVGAEALTVVTVGGLTGLAVAALNLLGMWGALHLLSAPAVIEIPWAAMGWAWAACAVLAVASSVAPAALALRGRAVEQAGVRE
ncbi:ABC transporter permease [Streptomyces bambusae]|uniref:FtsX-like permease family protein n=1 Tax=Streptomyces bambusae TaxID=1550616 RepID=A0ABS6ZD39_9ACTN|nr:ABC transporter permease [Streptomyces bambusae]MBW5485669.1 FtsX-like permease family protein [Streptomyces bambusae]